eukprot:353695-Chlamydomonas_euryale.AAC.16
MSRVQVLTLGQAPASARSCRSTRAVAGGRRCRRLAAADDRRQGCVAARQGRAAPASASAQRQVQALGGTRRHSTALGGSRRHEAAEGGRRRQKGPAAHSSRGLRQLHRALQQPAATRGLSGYAHRPWARRATGQGTVHEHAS